MFNSVLIANRGEIACRIIRTARRLGLRTIAVYSDGRRRRAACAARRRGDRDRPGAGGAELSGRRAPDRRRPGQRRAECIHPGYGFLAENADFAEACRDAGFAFIGPPPEAIRAMGLKDRAKALMRESRRAGGAGLSRRDAGAELPQAQGLRDRLSGADQAGGRRRRQGHAQGRAPRRFRRRAGSRAARGAERLRRGARADREIRQRAAPCRNAGVRRPPRPRHPSRRARLLAAAPPSEGDRGGAGARHDAGLARRDGRGRGRRRQGGRLRGRRHRGVHRRRRRRAARKTASGSWR